MLRNIGLQKLALFTILSLFCHISTTLAAEAEALQVKAVAAGVYALVGPLGQRDPSNLGNNATFGLVDTAKGWVLIDSGGSFKGAAQIEAAAKALKDQPIVLVINTGGQDHRWLGNGYFAAKGARLMASEAAVADQQARFEQEYAMLTALVGPEGMAGTQPVYATETFDETKTLTIGGVALILQPTGGAHTPGHAFVALPATEVVFAGDAVYFQRMLGVLEVSDTAQWLDALDQIAAAKPAVVVPGHGAPGDLTQMAEETTALLHWLRRSMKAQLDQGADLQTALKAVDRSPWMHLYNAEQLLGRNMQQVYMALEFE